MCGMASNVIYYPAEVSELVFAFHEWLPRRSTSPSFRYHWNTFISGSCIAFIGSGPTQLRRVWTETQPTSFYLWNNTSPGTPCWMLSAILPCYNSTRLVSVMCDLFLICYCLVGQKSFVFRAMGLCHVVGWHWTAWDALVLYIPISLSCTT